jgi:hypothetical protein
MKNASIRGHQGAFRVFENAALVNIVNLTSVEINQDSSFSRSFYVGNAIGEGDQAIEGWSGSVEAEVKDASIDEFIDALVTNNLNGIGVSDYTFISTENYPDGTSKSYAYFGVQWKMSKRQSGLNEKMTKRLEFQADGRISL